MKSRHFILFLCVIILIIYFQTLFNSFVWDDEYLILRNDYIKSFSHIKDIFKTDLFSNPAQKFFMRHSNAYRPIQSLSNMIDFKIWIYMPFGYHLTNMFLHFLSASLVFVFIRRLKLDIWVASFAAVLFSVHPIQTQAVSYISGRAEILATLFILGSLILYIRSDRSKIKSSYILSIIAFIFALLSKELAVIVPFLLILYDLNFSEKMPRDKLSILKPRYAPYFAILIVYLWLRLTIFNFRPGSDMFLNDAVFLERLLAVPKIIVEYLKILFFPLNLHMKHALIKVPSVINADFYVPLGILILIGGLLKKFIKKDKYTTFFISWFFITLLPQLNIFPINASIAEHWLYLPGIGIFGLLAYKSLDIYRKAAPLYKKLNLSVFILIILILSSITILRNRDWRNDITIYKATLKHVPDNPEMHYNLATALRKEGSIDDAISHYNQALRLDPKFSQALMNLGAIYLEKANYGEAIEKLTLCLKYNPKDLYAYNALGLSYEKMGDIKRAEDTYKRAISQNEDYFEARFNLGKLLLEKERFNEAIKEFGIIARKTNSSVSYYNLGYCYFSMGDLENAKKSYEKALSIDPNNKIAINALSDLTHNKIKE